MITTISTSNERAAATRATRSGRLMAAVAGVAATLFFPAMLMAQTRQVTPIADGVVMRSGNGSSWYDVATLKKDQVLRAEGEVDGWLRVDYLPGMRVVVKNDEAELQGDKVVLTRRTRFRALSASTPVLEESFRFVCDEPALPGTELKLVGRIKDKSGADAGYIVEAPACARGFVLAREVREVTAAPASTPAPTPAPASTTPAQPAPSQPAQTQPANPAQPAPAQPVTPPAAQPETAPATGTDGGTNPAATSSVAQPGATTAPATTTPPAGTEVPGAVPATGTPPTDGAAPADAAPVAPVVPVEPPKPQGPTIRQLDRMLEQQLSAPIEENDPQELIEQYEKYAVEAESKPGGSRLVQLAEQRLQVLRLRQKARGLLPDIQALEDRSKDAFNNYQLTIDRLVQNRQYLVAGRLLPSTVYDGERLPQMYRLVSIDPSINRTIAYIVPSPELQLEQKTGAIVGVLGDGTIEPSALVQIIRPTVVDVLRAAEAPAPEPVGSGQ